MDYQIIPEKKLIIENIEGDVTYERLVALVERINQDPGFSPDMDGIADLSQAEINMSYFQIFRFAEWLHSTSLKMTGRWALITRTPRNYGMVRMLTALDDRLQELVGHFNTVEEAHDWLGTDPGQPATPPEMAVLNA